MYSAPLIKPLGETFLGHPVWPSESQWYKGEFTYKLSMRIPKGVRRDKFRPELKEFVNTNLKHSVRMRLPKREVTIHLKCADDLATLVQTYNKLIMNISGPINLEHLNGIHQKVSFQPRSEGWFKKYDTRVETSMMGISGDLNKIQARDHLKELLDTNLSEYKVIGKRALNPTYYVNWQEFEMVLAFAKMGGAPRMYITRAMINDKYDEQHASRRAFWQ